MPAHAAQVAAPEQTRWPNYRESDFVIKDYVFSSGERLPELKLHYRTLGTAKRNTAGKIVNGVLLLQGNTGTGGNWLRPTEKVVVDALHVLMRQRPQLRVVRRARRFLGARSVAHLLGRHRGRALARHCRRAEPFWKRPALPDRQ